MSHWIPILQSMSTYDRNYYLRRGLQWKERKSRVLAFYYTQIYCSSVTYEVYVCFMPKMEMKRWYLCIIVDVFAPVTHGLLLSLSLTDSLDRRRPGIPYVVFRSYWIHVK